MWKPYSVFQEICLYSIEFFFEPEQKEKPLRGVHKSARVVFASSDGPVLPGSRVPEVSSSFTTAAYATNALFGLVAVLPQAVLFLFVHRSGTGVDGAFWGHLGVLRHFLKHREVEQTLGSIGFR